MSDHGTPTPAGRRWLPRYGRLALSIVLALIAAGVATPQPASASVDRTNVAPTRQASPSPGIGTQASAETVTGQPPTVGPHLRCEDCTPDPPCYPTYEYCPTFYIWCKPTITTSQSRGYDSTYGEYSRVSWNANWDCSTNYYTAHALISGRTVLYDRSSGYDGVPRAYGDAVYQNDHASSSGVAYLYDINHPIGESVEVVFETTLFMTGVSSANTWQVCNSISPLRYVTPCSGLGTQVLNVNVGTGGFSTGVTDPCSDPNRTRTDEQETQFSYGSLVDDVRIQFHPFIKWCWTGSQVAKISKYSNTYAWCDFDHPTWCDHEHFNIRPTTTDPTPFAVNGVGQYVVSFTIDVDPPPFPASNLRKQTCIYVVDRIYRANGQKEINDKLISCTPR